MHNQKNAHQARKVLLSSATPSRSKNARPIIEPDALGPEDDAPRSLVPEALAHSSERYQSDDIDGLEPTTASCSGGDETQDAASTPQEHDAQPGTQSTITDEHDTAKLPASQEDPCSVDDDDDDDDDAVADDVTDHHEDEGNHEEEDSDEEVSSEPSSSESSDSGESEESEEEEPQLKTVRLTANLGPIYRNGDATSAFLVGGDKMIIGTHNGNIHVLELPTFSSVRVYHAHSASVTAISASPFPPQLTEPTTAFGVVPSALAAPIRRASSIASNQTSTTNQRAKQQRGPPPVPNTPWNNIYIATSSTDGNVCIQSLLDPKDVQLRNFARPVQAVALSPEYKQDRTYLSGGLAGNLIVTVGGSTGRSTSTTIGTAAATASGWLGSIGLGAGAGRDTILHSGEGAISTIQWSRSGRYVAWVNEYGIKIMRSRIQVDDPEEAWRRIGHVHRPLSDEWDTMSGVWKARVEWIDDSFTESEAGDGKVERLVIGWGGTIWILNVLAGGIGTGRNVGERIPGRAEIANVLRMDCIISGLSFFSPTQLLVLAFCRPEDAEDAEDAAQSPPPGEPVGGIKRRVNNRPPELRLIDLESQVEVDKVGLIISRYERLSCNDYHMAVLPAPKRPEEVAKGALETMVGYGSEWAAAGMGIFSSGASIVTKTSEDAQSRASVSIATQPKTGVNINVDPNMAKPGQKIFIHSPYDCILATQRDLADHYIWLVEQLDFPAAWEVLDEHPTILDEEILPVPVSNADPTQEDASATAVTILTSNTTREKRRISDLWLRSLVDADSWVEAGRVAERILSDGDRWANWIFTFANASRFDEIVLHMPTSPMSPPIPSTCYEVILGHYIATDKLRVQDLLERWPTWLFDVAAVATALENQLKFRDVREDSVDSGVRGRDWRIVTACLAKLHEADGRSREALRCYIKLQDADNAFRIIKERHLAAAVGEDVPGFFNLRVQKNSTREELEIQTAEATDILVQEAVQGLVKPKTVVDQLMDRDLRLFTFFYLRGLWNGGVEGVKGVEGVEGVDNLAISVPESPPTDANADAGAKDRRTEDFRTLLDPFADLVVTLFATFDAALLLPFLRTSTAYTYTLAVAECEKRLLADELVFLYSATGEPRKALFLIIDRLGDVSKAIAFAKEQNDAELWEDLLGYGMDKPRFIRGLLREVGGCVEPIRLVRRIPEGLEIEGLKEGVGGLLREYEIMGSIAEGTARVLRSEVAGKMNELRAGQRRGVKFNVAADYIEEDEEVMEAPLTEPKRDIFGEIIEPERKKKEEEEEEEEEEEAPIEYKPGHCAGCGDAFTDEEMETLLGFNCGHIFHVRHLLEGTRRDRELIGGMGDGVGWLVGSKVTHARLLKGRVKGCAICKA